MYRFPYAVCNALGFPKEGMYGRAVSRSNGGCEIRFVTNGDRALISLEAIGGDAHVEVYRGDFLYFDGAGPNYCYPLKRGQVTQINLLKNRNFDGRAITQRQRIGGFSPDVWRLCISGTVALVDFEDYGYEVRPPRPDEIPRRTLLCYGTSLLHGACSSTYSLAHCQLLGRMLNVNILNKGMGGSCMNEPEISDYFVSDAIQFDAVLLENAVNMGTRNIDEYEKRTIYMMDGFTRSKPDVPVFFLTSYPGLGSCQPISTCPAIRNHEEGKTIDTVMRALAMQYPQAHLIEGPEMMNDLTALTCDGVHLSNYGHILAATNLARAIGSVWPGLNDAADSER